MTSLRAWLAPALLAALVAVGACSQSDQGAQVARGKYLVAIMGCSDCHTPGGLTPHPDMTLYLAGSDADFIVPGLGAFTPPNLTSDKATGLGAWTHDQIVAAFTTGKRPDGRVLSPAMPWIDFANLSKADADAIADYLQSLAPISRRIPGPRASTSCSDPSVECIVRRPPGD
jgi:mono/diheme cytochrome c family protein